MHMNSKTYQ